MNHRRRQSRRPTLSIHGNSAALSGHRKDPLRATCTQPLRCDEAFAEIRLSLELLKPAFHHACVRGIRNAGDLSQATHAIRMNRLMRATAKINKAHDREQSCASNAAKNMVVVAVVHGCKCYGL